MERFQHLLLYSNMHLWMKSEFTASRNIFLLKNILRTIIFSSKNIFENMRFFLISVFKQNTNYNCMDIKRNLNPEDLNVRI